MRAAAERRLWWLLAILILVGINALVSGCGSFTLGDPNLSQQIQSANVQNAPPMVFSDTAVWIVLGQTAQAWNGNNEISKLFSYTGQISLAALTIVALRNPAPAVLIGQSIWLALLKVFMPGEHSLTYAQGMLRLNDAMGEYIMCQASAGQNTVPRDAFTPCGAVLFQRVTSAVNLVVAQRVQLMPRKEDLQNTEPVKIQLPQTMSLPSRTVK